MQIDPIAFRLFGIPIYWYGVMISSALLFGTLVAMRRAPQYGVDEDDLLGFLLLAVPLAIVGARAVFVVENWDTMAGDFLAMINLRQGGLSIHGALIGGIIAGLFYTQFKRLSFWSIADITAPGLILGQAIGRWGNYFNQEAYGIPTDLPWALYIDGAYRHPIFFYEFVWNLLVFAYLIRISKKEKTPGGIFLRYLVGYSIGRFFIEGIRANTVFWGNLRLGQIVSVLLIVIGLLLLWWRKRQTKDEGGIVR
ncbi:MAG TPA: prolipoprotein diacylglyceryl transferase [Oscillospiraceae bacterium]|nr:prolipoprotein diacylglyceryl transferase [Oscillospiraceae bacterium]